MSQKYFYLHIPKTAGTTFNDFLKKNFSTNQCIFHLESEMDKVENKTVLSGHIALPKAEKIIPNFNEYIQLTVFREPLKQLSSHLRYVRKLAEPSEKKRLQQHTIPIQKIVARLSLIDLSSPKELQIFIQWLEDENLALFHNTQMQYLIGSRFKIDSVMLEEAKERLNKIKFVGITEKLDDYMRLLTFKLKLPNSAYGNKKLNITSENFGLDIEDQETQKVLEPLIHYDKIIYQQVKDRFEKEYLEVPKSKQKVFYIYLDKIGTIFSKGKI